MQSMTQFSVFMANRPGVLAQVTRELARSKVNVLALTMMDAQEHGVLRLLTDDVEATREVLRRVNVSQTETEVLCVPLANRPGSVADVCERLAEAHMQINYVYCTAGAGSGKANAIFKVPDIKRAMKIIENHKSTKRDMQVSIRRPKAARR